MNLSAVSNVSLVLKKSIVLGATVLVTAFAFSTSAEAAPPAKLKMSVGIGLGFQLCPEKKTPGLPDLQDAFLCSGLKATPQKIELELENKPAAKPEWLFYEAPYTQTLQFKDVKVTLEMLVMYAKYDGQTSGFVDGRIISEQNGKQTAPVYFRYSAGGGLDKISYSSAFGAASPIPLSNGVAQFSPYVAVEGM